MMGGSYFRLGVEGCTCWYGVVLEVLRRLKHYVAYNGRLVAEDDEVKYQCSILYSDVFR